MAKQTTLSAKHTSELPGIPAKLGRPVTGKAKSAAERMRAYRKRVAASQREAVRMSASIFQTYDLPQLSDFLTGNDAELAYNAWVEIGRRNGFLK